MHPVVVRSSLVLTSVQGVTRHSHSAILAAPSLYVAGMCQLESRDTTVPYHEEPAPAAREQRQQG
jgi:hypothetical protein